MRKHFCMELLRRSQSSVNLVRVLLVLILKVRGCSLGDPSGGIGWTRNVLGGRAASMGCLHAEMITVQFIPPYNSEPRLHIYKTYRLAFVQHKPSEHTCTSTGIFENVPISPCPMKSKVVTDGNQSKIHVALLPTSKGDMPRVSIRDFPIRDDANARACEAYT